MGLKAVLSGVGGDELFGGYPSFKRISTVNKLGMLPDIFLKNVYKSGAKRRLCYLSLGGAKGKYLFLRGQFIPIEISQQLNIDESEVWKILDDQPALNNISDLSLKNQASWMEMNMYMQNQLLRDSDVMSMAHGVEIRVPFLDKEFVSLSLQIASKAKYYGKFGKQLLIDSFIDIVPEKIWNRNKMGFTFPFNNWLKTNPLVQSIISSSTPSAKLSYKKFIEGNMHWSQLMTLVLLQKDA
jgi:asparagine synthase (glutamine-hydrolysing)